ncbi:hypothetical protein [Streptomyces sp. NPDC088910]|uniref:hypothetical protein n=1 Tax=Streptomyces sp. NPDC088910 TaxID=3365911 RepID=UPI00380C4A25
MSQNFFEPRTPVRRPRPPGPALGLPPGLVPGLEPAAREGKAAGPSGGGGPSGPGEPPRPGGPDEPSWLRIYWNTLRSFVRRHLGLRPKAPAAPGEQAARRHRGRALAVTVLVLAVVSAAAVVVLRDRGGSGTGSGTEGSDRPTAAVDPNASASGSSSGSSSASSSASVSPSTPPPIRDAVATWVAGHIGPTHVVACDVAVCAALVSHGFPAGSTLTVTSSPQQLLGADVAVVTGPLRAMAGDALRDLTGPQPLAVFGGGEGDGAGAGDEAGDGPGSGSGTDAAADAQRAEVLPIAHAGRTAYERVAAADRAERRFSGAALAANQRITFQGGTRALLTSGHVDLRVCALLAVLSSGHTLTVASFDAPAPGAGADVPRGGVAISRVDGVPATGSGPQAAALRALVDAQQPPYRPLRTAARTGGAGTPAVLTVLYDQPAPDGLVSANSPS